jgi:hypothetical protein
VTTLGHDLAVVSCSERSEPDLFDAPMRRPLIPSALVPLAGAVDNSTQRGREIPA